MNLAQLATISDFFGFPLYRRMRLFLFLIAFGSLQASAQMFLNELGDIFGNKPYFNQEFIMMNRIKSMYGEYSTKAELDYIYQSSDFVYYEFNRAGQLVFEKRSKYRDTTEYTYEYHNNSTLAKILKRDKYGYHSYSFEYDTKLRLLKTTYHQHRTDRKLMEPFDLKQAKLVSEEAFDYMDLSDIMYKKIYLNSSGDGYKDEFYHFDEGNQLLRQESRLKTGTGVTEVDYHYDENGRLTEKSSMVKFINAKVKKFQYTYDEKGNLESIKEFQNDFYMLEYQLVYKEDGSLKAIIKRTVPSNFMTILKFTEYTYHARL